MFSFKKKDKDKTETKEEKRERRKREKAEKGSRKHEKKAQSHAQPDQAIADIVAGNTVAEDDKKATRFSFRKRKYDVDHEYDETKSPDFDERVDLDVRQSYHSTSSEGSGPSSHRHGSPRESINKGTYQDYDDYYQNGVHNNGSNRGQDNEGPVPAPRKRNTSSLEIKLNKGDNSNGSDSDRERAERSTGYKMEKNEARKTSKSHGFPPGGRTIALSGTPKGDKQNIDPSAPPKPPRVVKADDSGMVELRLVNAGRDRPTIKMSNQPREVVTTSTISNSYSTPFEDFMDASMEEKPIQADNVQRLESSDGISIDVTSPSEKSFDDLGVEFSLPEVVPASPGVPRVIKIQRRLSGDFGFALRRGTSSGSDKTVHFVEPVGPNTVAGLLPGDRLIEVNGVNVEGVDREKIIEMIAMSGNEVVIKVVPVSELSELSVRSGLDGSTVQLDESNLKAGTLQRSGSKRMKKKVRLFIKLMYNHTLNS